jgi:hypothetical protein
MCPSAANGSKAALLMLERERSALAARLHRGFRRPSDRYRDLTLITGVIRLESEHLAGRAAGQGKPGPEPEDAGGLGSDRPADWAQPWASSVGCELRLCFDRYSQRRERAARWLSQPSRANAAADAQRRLAGVRARFDGVMGLEVERAPVSAWQAHAEALNPRVPTTAAREREMNEVRPGWLPRLKGAAAAGAALLLVAAVGALVASPRGGAPSRLGSLPGHRVASLPRAPIAAPRRPTRGPRPKRSGVAKRSARNGSPPVERHRRGHGASRPAPAEGTQSVATTAEAASPAPAPVTVPEAAPTAPAPAPVTSSAPAPTTAVAPSTGPTPTHSSSSPSQEPSGGSGGSGGGCPPEFGFEC